MYLLANVLTPDALARLKDIFDGSDSFIDGRKTAGRRAARVKRNEQLDFASQEVSEAQTIVVTALNRHPAFRRLAIPRQIAPPLIKPLWRGYVLRRACR